MCIVFSKRTLCLKIYWYAQEFLKYEKKCGLTSCVPRCLLHVYASLNAMSKEMFQLRPKGSAPCVS
jgi:hypothetical protein